MRTANRLPIVVEKAEGNYLYDMDGKRYLDLFTGLGVNILGHRHPALMHALKKQAEQFLHISNYFYNPSAIRLAERLVTYTLGEGNVFYSNSGAEVTESLVKLIHKWSQHQEDQKSGIVVLTNSFHGRTLGALHLTRQHSVHQDFPKLDFPIYEVPPNKIRELVEICKRYQPAAILIEPILGSGGVISLTKEYLHAIEAICKEGNILYCIDEIQTGIGRTGRLFAYQEYDIQPDVILFAKAIGGGLPLGGLIAGKKTKDLFKPGDHGTTFAPSPLATAMAHEVLDLLMGGVLEQSQEMIQYLWKKLGEFQHKFPHAIDFIDGRGMMVGIHTHLSHEEVKKIQLKLLEEGILIDITARTVIRLLPPLTLTIEEINLFFGTLEKYL
jgi:acetylornithine aminotransferase